MGILSLGAYLRWSHPVMASGLLLPMAIGAFVLAMIIVFIKFLSPILSPIYAFVKECYWDLYSLHLKSHILV